MANIKEWDDLSYQSRLRIFKLKPEDPRIPPGWSPYTEEEQARRKEQRREPSDTGRRRYTTYNHPAAVIIDLDNIISDLTERELWTLLETGWTKQGISPHRVIFRSGSVVLATMDNPVFRTGKLPVPVVL